MPVLPEPLQNLIDAFERLPGIGPKSASRLVFFLLRAPDEVAKQLADALQELDWLGNLYHRRCLGGKPACWWQQWTM